MFAIKAIFILSLGYTISAQMPGSVQKATGKDLKEAEDELKFSLTRLASGDGPYYKIGNIFWATKQIVAGVKYRYLVELIEGSRRKTCYVEIISQPWLPNGVKVTFDCPDGKVVKKHSYNTN